MKWDCVFVAVDEPTPMPLVEDIEMIFLCRRCWIRACGTVDFIVCSHFTGIIIIIIIRI